MINSARNNQISMPNHRPNQNNNNNKRDEDWDICWDYFSAKGCSRDKCRWKHGNPKNDNFNNKYRQKNKNYRRQQYRGGRNNNYGMIQQNNNNTVQTQWFDESQAQTRPPTVNRCYHDQHIQSFSIILELENLGERSKEMALQLVTGTYDCMVCQSSIGKKARVWTCHHCYTVFHITCTNKWARARENKDAEAEQRVVKTDYLIDKIRCPACNYVDINFIFNQYKCFCGKMIFDHEYQSRYTSNIPHSCGAICGKQRGIQCPHTCTAICHPGPCDACTLPSKRQSHCPCGKLTYSLLCGKKETKSRLCKQICNKTLLCGNHKCTLLCHESDCQQCDIKIKQQCFCGRYKTTLRPCGSGTKCNKVWKYSCMKICNKQLSCKNHKCKLICHNGSCSGCHRRVQTPTRCVCGKSTFPNVVRQSCLDVLPVCKGKCGRMLACGQHFCRRKCHDSKCALCMLQVKRACRCGASLKKFKCPDYHRRLKQFISRSVQDIALLMDGQDSWIRCGKKCKRVKSCGKHICALICCRGRSFHGYFEAHQCRELCGKALSCGKHLCSSYCHSGQCNPCGVTYRNGVHCACGNVYVVGPFQCGTKKIPQCQSICNKLLLGCGHLCPCKCHHGDCPKCIRICSKPCVSHGVMVRNMPCYVSQRSCGDPCGKLLDCGVHKCKRICHVGVCRMNNKNENKKVSINSTKCKCGGNLEKQFKVVHVAPRHRKNKKNFVHVAPRHRTNYNIEIKNKFG